MTVIMCSLPALDSLKSDLSNSIAFEVARHGEREGSTCLEVAEGTVYTSRLSPEKRGSQGIF